MMEVAMQSPRPYRRLVMVAGVTAAFAAPLGAPASAAPSGGDADGEIVVETTGDDASAVLLPPAAAVGQAARTSATIGVSLSADGREVDLAVDIELASTITEVAADGGYRAVVTMERIELTDPPAGVDPASLGYDDLAGVRFAQTVDGAGRITGTELLDAGALSEEARNAADGFAAYLRTAQFAFPGEPVGIGAAWTTELEIATEGFAVPASYRFELTDVADGRYELAVSYRSEFETTIDGVDTAGTVVGLGLASGSLDNPLDVTLDVGQTIDATTDAVALGVAVRVTTAQRA
jgi:hypothetical protein